MRQDDSRPDDMMQKPRFAELGSQIKVIAGVAVIVMTWLSIGLGFISFGLFLYLHLLLHKTNRPRNAEADSQNDAPILAPMTGHIVAIRKDSNGLQLDVAGDMLASQLIYAPIAAKIDDKLWIDGLYERFDDARIHPLRARYDFLFETSDEALITLSLFGGKWTRYIHAPFSAGQVIRCGEPFAVGLCQSLITLHLPNDYQCLAREGDYCIARQSLLASKR